MTGALTQKHLISSHELSLSASFFDIIVDNSDDFVNLYSRPGEVSSSQWQAMKRAAPHGLLVKQCIGGVTGSGV